jgi:putative SOS response-associated peptidase YedK
MCGRFVLADKLTVIEKAFGAKLPEGETLFAPNYNISVGQKSLVITNEDPKLLQYYHFGLTPFWAKKHMYLFNARAEGDHNKENDPNFRGAKGIIKKPAFRNPIRSKRCLVVASAFIEGTTNEGLDKPYLVHLRSRPFAFAGIWDNWTNPVNQEIIHSFSIITTSANSLLQKIPHHRMPVILPGHTYHTWLNNNSSLSQITELLQQYPADQMNAYPITPSIKNPNNNSVQLLNPLGERLIPETEFKVVKRWEVKGFGSRKRG